MTRRTWGLLVVALVAAGVISLFASSHPDGLERVLEDLHVTVGSAERFTAPLSDYQVPAVKESWLSGSLAGIIGMILTLGIAWGAFRLLTHSHGRARGRR